MKTRKFPWFLACIVLLGLTRILGADDVPQKMVTVSDIKPDTNAGVGFDLLDNKSITMLILRLVPADGWRITNSECTDNVGDQLWVLDKSSGWDWKTTGDPSGPGNGQGASANFYYRPGIYERSHAARFHGTLARIVTGGGTSGGGHPNPPPPVYDAAISDIDMDVDSTGLHQDANWTPTSPHDMPDRNALENRQKRGEDGGMAVVPTTQRADLPDVLPNTADYNQWKAVRVALNAKWQPKAPETSRGTLQLQLDAEDASSIAIYKLSGDGTQQVKLSNPVTINIADEHVSQTYMLHTLSTFSNPATLTATFTSGNSGAAVSCRSARDIVRLYPMTFEFFESNEYIVPESSRNYVRYRWSAQGSNGPNAVTMEVRDNAGTLVRTITGLPTSYVAGQDYAEFTWDGKDSSGEPLTQNSSAYTITLTAYGMPGDTGTGVSKSMTDRMVKMWSVAAVFWDRLSDAEKAAIDAAFTEDANEYQPLDDPFYDPSRPATSPQPYCAGVDLSTVTPASLSASTWFWYESSSVARTCEVSNGISTATIPPSEWQPQWGEQQWYEDRGAAISAMGGHFYSMDDGQSYRLRVVVGSGCGRDLANNDFDGDGSSRRTVTYAFRIDGAGAVTLISEVWE